MMYFKKKMTMVGKIIAACSIAVVLAGCGKTTNPSAVQDEQHIGMSIENVDTRGLADALSREITFGQELHYVEDEIARVFFGLDEADSIALCMSNSGSETIAVIDKSNKNDETVQALVDSFLQDQRMSFKGYSPKDVELIDHAWIDSIGHFMVLVICEDSNSVNTVKNDILSGKIVLQVSNEQDAATKLDIENISSQESKENASEGTIEKETTEKETTAVETEPIVIEPIYKSGEVKRYKGVTVVGDTGYAFFGYNEEMMQAYTGALKKLAEALDGVSTVYSVPIPMSGGITFPDNLASETTYTVQKDALDNMERMFDGKVKLVNMNDILMQHRTEYLFFRTDHHWTALGAYYGYRKFCEKKGIEPEELDSYETKEFPGFSGSYCYGEDGGVQDYEMFNNPDTITAYLPHDPSTLHIINRDGGEFDWEVIYDVSSAGAGTKYITFGVGDYPLATVHNENKHDGSACIVVKDSFANCFVPFLVDHYEYIYGIDYRYGREHLVDFAKEHNVQDILFVVAMQNTGNGYAVGRMQEFCQ